MISVIIPVYNVEAYIDRCLESVINQTYKDLQIIIINDGSTDNTGSKCIEWKNRDDRILYYDKENRGLSSSRNVGLSFASGELLFFLDSDDWIEKETFEILVKKQILYGADIVCVAMKCVYEDGKIELFNKINKEFVLSGSDAVREMISGKSICSVTCNKLYKRSLWEGIEFPLGRLHEDEFTTYKLLYLSNRVVYVGMPLYCYFQRDNGIMACIRRGSCLDKLDALEERTNWFEHKKEDRISLLSSIERINYIKYLYRNSEIDKTYLMTIYRNDATILLKRKALGLLYKVNIMFWYFFLPLDMRADK